MAQYDVVFVLVPKFSMIALYGALAGIMWLNHRREETDTDEAPSPPSEPAAKGGER